jgi:hypothetical protein
MPIGSCFLSGPTGIKHTGMTISLLLISDNRIAKVAAMLSLFKTLDIKVIFISWARRGMDSGWLFVVE